MVTDFQRNQGKKGRKGQNIGKFVSMQKKSEKAPRKVTNFQRGFYKDQNQKQLSNKFSTIFHQNNSSGRNKKPKKVTFSQRNTTI